MAEGFVPAESEGLGGVSQWLAGAPEFGFLGRARTTGKTAYRIRTFRCVKCGHLASYAPDKV
jgi:hypothetical protein